MYIWLSTIDKTSTYSPFQKLLPSIGSEVFVLFLERLRGECDKEKKAREEVFVRKYRCVFWVTNDYSFWIGFYSYVLF